MEIRPGTRLGPYEIISAIGAGGMGEVYRARDTRLGREVAVKILPESFARDADRLRRFEQEARAVAALNHPNVMVVFDTGVQDGVPYLVSELLEGESLRDRLKQGPIPPRKALDYALQIAEGLAAAHEKGMVHRDLKPGNLFLTTSGRVKILDFGLAKLERPDAGVAATATLAGQAEAVTATGMVIGTAAYMSPEQVRGEHADHRSDLFSFGAVLYEMLTGTRAFGGQSSIETMNAILKEDPPDIDTAQLKVSPGLERVVRHSLEKNARDRFQSARDLAFALSALSGTETTAALAARMPRKRPWLAWLAAGLAVVALAVLGVLLARRTPRLERVEFAILVQEEAKHLALSPDGRMLAFVSPDEASGENMLHMQRVGSRSVTLLPGTEGASYPFWSPDDAYAAFFADGKLKKVGVSGAAPQVVAAASFGRGGSWGRSNVIVYAPDASGPLWRVNADGSNAAALTDKLFGAGEVSHRWPVFLPDGDHFLFWAGNFENASDDSISGIYTSSLAAKEKKLVVLGHSNPGYADRYLFYLNDKRDLIALPMDGSKGKVSGEARMAVNAVGFQEPTYWGAFSVAENGTVVYNANAGASLSILSWYDRTGKDLGRVGDVGVIADPSLSPDGNRVAVDITDLKVNNIDIWIDDSKRGTSTRFTFDPAEETTGVWSRDGSMIAYRTAARGEHLAVKKATGLEAEKPIVTLTQRGDVLPNSWSGDDSAILCSLQPASGGSRFVLVPLTGGKMVPFLADKASDTNGQISPDGKWVACAYNESGDWEIYVTTFPSAAGKWQVSRGGGTEPRWRGDGKEIYYISLKGVLTAVPVNTEEAFSVGVPTPLFQVHARAPISSTDLFTYDVAKDGNRFLVNRYVKPEHIPPLFVVLNATADLQK